MRCRKGNRFMVVTGVTEGSREVSTDFCVCRYSQPSVNENTARRCMQIGTVSVLTFECRPWHMIPLVENILYLTFLVCLALSRTKLHEQQGSSFEDGDTWILWLTVSLGTSSSQVVPARCTGLPSIYINFRQLGSGLAWMCGLVVCRH